MTEDISKQTKNFIRSLLTSTPLACTIRNLEIDYKNTIGEEIPFHRMGYSSLEQYLRSISDVVAVKGSGPYAEVVPVVSEKSAHISQMVMAQKVTRKGPRRSIITNRKTIRYPLPPRLQANKSNSGQGSNVAATSISNQVPVTNISAPSASKSDNTSNNVNKESSNGYENTARIRQNNVTRNVQPNKLKENNKIRIKPIESINESNIPLNVQENLKKLISQHENGIWCAELPILYKKQFGSNLHFSEYGYRCLINMCSALPDIFRFVRPGIDDFLLYDANSTVKPLPDVCENSDKTKNFEQTNETLEDKEDMTNFELTDYLMMLPDIFLSSEIKRGFLPPNIKENDALDIVVAEIYDLSKFWVYLNNKQLDNLMDEMQVFYGEHAKEYEIPPHLLCEGLYCTQIVLGEYTRGLIVDTLDHVPEKVKVLFIDYGTMTKVSMRGMCFLTKYFANLPAQAIRCRLASIKPIYENSTWTTEAIERFKQLVTRRDISAKINAINRKDKFIEVYLADTTDKKVTYVNDILVEEKLAIKADEEQQPEILPSHFKPITKSIYLFPTFFELEYGLVPSDVDMKQLLSDGVPVNFCFPQYFQNTNKKLDEEPDIIKRIEEIGEKLTILSETPIPHDYDIEALKPKELDFSIFGDLEEEMREFVQQNENQQQDKAEQKNLSHLLCDLNLEISDNEDEEEINSPLNSTNPFFQNDIVVEVEKSSTNPFLYDLDDDEVNEGTKAPFKEFFHDLKIENQDEDNNKSITNSLNDSNDSDLKETTNYTDNTESSSASTDSEEENNEGACSEQYLNDLKMKKKSEHNEQFVPASIRNLLENSLSDLNKLESNSKKPEDYIELVSSHSSSTTEPRSDNNDIESMSLVSTSSSPEIIENIPNNVHPVERNRNPVQNPYYIQSVMPTYNNYQQWRNYGGHVVHHTYVEHHHIYNYGVPMMPMQPQMVASPPGFNCPPQPPSYLPPPQFYNYNQPPMPQRNEIRDFYSEYNARLRQNK